MKIVSVSFALCLIPWPDPTCDCYSLYVCITYSMLEYMFMYISDNGTNQRTECKVDRFDGLVAFKLCTHNEV
jgi:hypothetical protein